MQGERGIEHRGEELHVPVSTTLSPGVTKRPAGRTPAGRWQSGYQKGVVWVNGHSLGRYWEIGPQKRLYCPAGWLKRGENEILVLDLHQLQAAPGAGFAEMEPAG